MRTSPTNHPVFEINYSHSLNYKTKCYYYFMEHLDSTIICICIRFQDDDDDDDDNDDDDDDK